MAKIALIKNNVVVNVILSDLVMAQALPGYDVAVDITESPDVGIGWSHMAGEFSPAPVPPMPVPRSVTMRQARLALLSHNLLSSVGPAIAALPEPARTRAQIEWEYSNALERDNAFVAALGVALGLDSGAIDNLFIDAATL